jgi:hypothetical protein
VELFVGVLAFAWVPTVVGLVRLWGRYWPLRHDPAMWLLQLFCIIATLVTPVVLFISLSSSIRLLGGDPLPYGPLFGAVSALIIAAVVPIMEIRVHMWINGAVVDPIAPVNGKVSSGS